VLALQAEIEVVIDRFGGHEWDVRARRDGVLDFRRVLAHGLERGQCVVEQVTLGRTQQDAIGERDSVCRGQPTMTIGPMRSTPARAS